MKRIATAFMAALACTLAFLPSPSRAATNDTVKIWIEVRPAFFSHIPVQHTYLVAQLKNGKRFTCPCLGHDTDGEVLGQTTWVAPIPLLDRILFMCDKPPCAWPKVLYGAVGVCHQMANRGLYSLGSTVEGARGYGMSHYFYGVYGRFSRFSDDYDMKLCLENAPRREVPERNKPEKQVLLFRGLMLTLQNLSPMMLDTRWARLYKSYSWDSVRERLRLALGEKTAAELAPRVEEYWGKNFDQQVDLLKKHLEKMIATKRVDTIFKERMNQLLFKTQDQFRQLLTPEQYEAFFLLPWPKDRSQYIDWGYFDDEKGPGR